MGNLTPAVDALDWQPCARSTRERRQSLWTIRTVRPGRYRMPGIVCLASRSHQYRCQIQDVSPTRGWPSAAATFGSHLLSSPAGLFKPFPLPVGRHSSHVHASTAFDYCLSPGDRYLIGAAFLRAAIVSSTVSNGVVWRELRAPPAAMAIAVAAIETLSGASHRLYAS
jgi:hypothetical protein